MSSPDVHCHNDCMIKVARLNGLPLWINPDQIRWVESTPDTIVTFTDGTKIAILSTPEQVSEAILARKQQIATGPNPSSASTSSATGATTWIS